MTNFLREWGVPIVGSMLLYVSIVAIGWIPASWMGEALRTFTQDVHTIADSVEERERAE